MSQSLSKENVIQNKKSAIKTLNSLLEKYINIPSDNYLKKANLISYWIKDYSKMLNFEEKFEPTKNISYSRGNIIKLNFGFNIGSEYGGLHYGIVLDKHNAHHSPVVTVIPLTSTKAGKQLHTNNVDLGNEIYKLLSSKYNSVLKELTDEKEYIGQMLSSILSAIDLVENIVAEANTAEANSEEKKHKLLIAQNKLKSAMILRDELEEKQKHNHEQQVYLDNIGKEISKMKEGSVALVSQITTVSKIRIFDPKNAKGILSNISLSQVSMDKINDKMKELYIF